MPSLPSLALARWIVKAFRFDDFTLFIVHGTPRIGKSAYAIKAMGQVVDYLWGEDIFTVTGSTGHRRAPIGTYILFLRLYKFQVIRQNEIRRYNRSVNRARREWIEVDYYLRMTR